MKDAFSLFSKSSNVDMSNRAKNRKACYPTIDQFHSILEKVSPGTKFSKSAIEGFREVYLQFLGQVGESLTQWDSLKEEEKIVEALSVNPLFVEYVDEAKGLLSKPKPACQKPAAKKRKKRKLPTEADAAEQERLLAQSKKNLCKES